ncbi:hypothetical protein AB1Y20_011855 [Prymnesium parvum]|uniref:Uncharacterized protein n=1 Tax=Prymnesium parvum TaxID=97485 RepID=A0AB34IIL4_PRYPA
MQEFFFLEPARLQLRRALTCHLASSLPWAALRLRIHRRLLLRPPPTPAALAARLAASHSSGLLPPSSPAASLAGAETIAVCRLPSGSYRPADAPSLLECLAASFVGGTLRAAAAPPPPPRLEALLPPPLPPRLRLPPRLQREAAGWGYGAIDATHATLLHARPPAFLRVLAYAQRLEAQAGGERLLDPSGEGGGGGGGGGGAPPVQLSLHPWTGEWVVRDGAHRTFAARLAGAPLAVKWKLSQREWPSLALSQREALRRRWEGERDRISATVDSRPD